MTTQEELRSMLGQLRDFQATLPPRPGYCYTGGYDFVLRHGQPFGPAPLPPGVERGAPKCCFGNAIMYALLRGWHYVEGYALPVTPAGAVVQLPVHHAWNSAQDGEVIDSTWDQPGAAYLGVIFSLGRADDATWNGDAAVLDDWKRGWPLFKQPWDGEDFARQWRRSPALKLAAKLQTRKQKK